MMVLFIFTQMYKGPLKCIKTTPSAVPVSNGSKTFIENIDGIITLELVTEGI